MSATLSPMAVLGVVVLTLAAVVTLSTASLSRCPEDQYMTDKSACIPCSKCPKNQIIRRPCTKDSNTLCGPFFEFHEFHQAPRPSLDVGDLPSPDEGGGGAGAEGDERGEESNRSKKIKDLLESLDKEGAGENHHKKHPHPKHKHHHNHHKGDHHGSAGRGKGENQVDKDPDGYEVYPDVREDPVMRNPSVPGYHDGLASRPRHQDKQVPSLTTPDDGENQWKVLALALIVVLCVVCIFLIIFVFVICYMRSRRAHMKKVLYSAGNSPIGRNAAGRATPFPPHSYIPVFTHAQGRAGTSGGAMSAPPCGMVDSSYLYSDEYDADNSGQTISTTKSSDYVYFKTPQNGNSSVQDV